MTAAMLQYSGISKELLQNVGDCSGEDTQQGSYKHSVRGTVPQDQSGTWADGKTAGGIAGHGPSTW